MAMRVFNTCCLCLSLRTGCILIAVLEMIILILANIAAGQSISLDVIGTNIIATAFVGLLIYGIVMENCISLWLWVMINNVVIGLLFCVIGVCAFHWTLDTLPRLESPSGFAYLITFILALLVAGILACCATRALFSYVVHSYTCELRNRENCKNEYNDENIGKPNMYIV